MIANHRFGDQHVVRLVAVDRRPKHQRDDGQVQHAGGERRARRTPADVFRGREGDKGPTRGDDQHAQRDESEVGINFDLKGTRRQRQEGEDQHSAHGHREVAAQCAPAKHQERVGDRRGDEERRANSKSTDSICSLAPAGRSRAAVIRMLRPDPGSVTRPAPCIHAVCP